MPSQKILSVADSVRTLSSSCVVVDGIYLRRRQKKEISRASQDARTLWLQKNERVGSAVQGGRLCGLCTRFVLKGWDGITSLRNRGSWIE